MSAAGRSILHGAIRHVALGAAVLLTCAARPLPAQHGAPRAEVLTLVRISGTVHPRPTGEPPLPFALLQQIEAEPALVHMETRAQARPALVLTFGFRSVAAYRAWCEAPATRRLLEALRARVSRLEMTVSLSRGAVDAAAPG